MGRYGLNPQLWNYSVSRSVHYVACKELTKLFVKQKLWTEENYIRYLDELATRNIIPNYPKLRGEAKASS